MGRLLWNPTKEQISQANITRFIEFVNKKYGLKIDSYWPLYEWSIERLTEFWTTIWEFVGLTFSRGYDEVVDDLNKFPGARWFVGARLNFAENLMRYRDNHLAFVFKGEEHRSSRMTYAELYEQVSRLAKSLRDIGVVPGDRVCAYMPNLMETGIAMLATTSVGAVWSSSGADLGPTALLDRFGQIKPKVLFTVDGYFYKGRAFTTLHNAEKLAEAIPSLKKVIVIPYVSQTPTTSIPQAVLYEEFLSRERPSELGFEQLPFDHPVYIMFSSGTTGKPKSIVQGAGGVLLNQLKDLLLHTDLRREDKITYITSPSWMMWNWLMCSLGVGATIVLYDGNPNYPNWSTMWRLAQEEKITIFGCSASYINYLAKARASPGKSFDLSSLREISQTGSSLSAEGFEWVYHKVKENLHLNPISGGTDINCGFAVGNPTLPVYAGELQAPALGMKIRAYDEQGNSVVDKQGELVCESPSPSMPLFFWNDPNNEKYEEAYFNFFRFTGRRVWRHGDFIIMHSDTGGITFLGRSDAVLKSSGVRIGTAEIYRMVERMPEIADSIVIGQNWKGDQRILLFVQLSEGEELTQELEGKIRRTLRANASPRHVPDLIIKTPAIPYTFNMKKVESAVANIINGRPVTNRNALTNPEALEFFEKILPELRNSSLKGQFENHPRDTRLARVT